MARTLHLKFIVNGEPCHVSVLDTLMFNSMLERVLIQSNNASRPLREWELRRANGALVAYNPQALLHASNIDEVQVLYMCLHVGANG